MQIVEDCLIQAPMDGLRKLIKRIGDCASGCLEGASIFNAKVYLEMRTWQCTPTCEGTKYVFPASAIFAMKHAHRSVPAKPRQRRDELLRIRHWQVTVDAYRPMLPPNSRESVDRQGSRDKKVSGVPPIKAELISEAHCIDRDDRGWRRLRTCGEA